MTNLLTFILNIFSSMLANTNSVNVRLPTIYTGLQGSVPPEKNERRELEVEVIFHCHFLLTRGWYL